MAIIGLQDLAQGLSRGDRVKPTKKKGIGKRSGKKYPYEATWATRYGIFREPATKSQIKSFKKEKYIALISAIPYPKPKRTRERTLNIGFERARNLKSLSKKLKGVV